MTTRSLDHLDPLPGSRAQHRINAIIEWIRVTKLSGVDTDGRTVEAVVLSGLQEIYACGVEDGRSGLRG